MQEVVGVEENMAIVDMDVFHKYLVLYKRRAGLPCVQLLDIPLKDGICGVSFSVIFCKCMSLRFCLLALGRQKYLYTSDRFVGQINV